MESSINKTSIPKSLKYSAIVVATKAAFILTSEGCSEVAAITTERFIPSGPNISSINSLTSRPRSPIRAITLSCAEVFFAIIPIVVLLPTPEPAKIPILCPLPTVVNPSIARIPSERASEIRFLFRGFIASALVER